MNVLGIDKLMHTCRFRTKTEGVRYEKARRSKNADRYKAVTPKGREVWQAAMMSKLQDKKCNK